VKIVQVENITAVKPEEEAETEFIFSSRECDQERNLSGGKLDKNEGGIRLNQEKEKVKVQISLDQVHRRPNQKSYTRNIIFK
jgi:hypothetical protein